MRKLKRELLRKGLHLSGLIFPVSYYFILSRDAVTSILAIAVITTGILELMRICGTVRLPCDLFRSSEERSRTGGWFLALLSMLIVAVVFDRQIAIAAMAFMLVGDAATGIAGAIMVSRGCCDRVIIRTTQEGSPERVLQAIGSHKHPALMAIMFLSCMIPAMIAFPEMGLPVIIAGSAGAVIAESFPWMLGDHSINDDFSITILSGSLMGLAAAIL